MSPIFRALKHPVKLRWTPQAYRKEKPLLGIIQDRVRSQRPGRRVLCMDVRTSISTRRAALEEAKPSEGGKEQGSTHASEAANTKCPQGSFRTSPARAVGRALSKRTSPAAPKPGSYWGSRGTQGQGGKQTRGRGVPPKPQQPHCWSQPTADLLQSQQTLLQEECAYSPCSSFSHRYKPVSHCDACTESSYLRAMGQLQREGTETYQISTTIPV